MAVTLYIDLQNEDTDDIIDFIKSNSWSGARDRVNDATDDQLERVAENLQLYFEGFTSETTINDFIWFDCDDIFFEDDDE